MECERRTQVDACEWARQSVEIKAKCIYPKPQNLQPKKSEPPEGEMHVRGSAGVLEEDGFRTLS
jgi:hypothetical protein